MFVYSPIIRGGIGIHYPYAINSGLVYKEVMTFCNSRQEGKRDADDHDHNILNGNGGESLEQRNNLQQNMFVQCILVPENK